MASYLRTPELLTRQNFLTWKKEITRLFEIEGLTPWLDKSTQPTLEKKSSIDDFRIQQSKSRAAGLLKEFCSVDIEPEIVHLSDPADIWKQLNETLQQSTRSYKAVCIAEFTNLMRQPDEEITTFIARFEQAYRKLTDIKEEISEPQRCYKLIQNLDETYDFIAREFENCNDYDFTFTNLKEQIVKEYNHQKLKEISQQETFCSMKEKLAKSNLMANKSQDQKATCENYMRKESLTKKSSYHKSSDNTYVSEFKGECYASTELPPPTLIWTLDSASTSHICQNREYFIDLKPATNSIVKMGTTPHLVKGIGTVQFTIKTKRGNQIQTLKNTLYVPTVHKNLISMSKMDKAGLHAKLDRGFKIFSPRWEYLWSADLKDNFYVIKGYPMRNNVTINNSRLKFNKSDTEKRNRNSENSHQAYLVQNDLNLWHERLGHCNFNTLKSMFKNKMVEPEIDLKGTESKCEACIFGKNTRQTYPRLEKVRSKGILELVHTDIWGPAPYRSRHGYRYILTFLDDYSRRIFCYPLRSKDEVFVKTKNFINFVERQTNRKVKTLRSDNGMEYCSRQMQQFLADIGIKHEKTNIYSAQQNGAAERINRVLLEGTRALLKSGNLPQEHWLEALQTTAYLRNRTFHSSIKDIPFTRWFHRKPSLKHLKRYGCLAFVHVPSQKRDKFQPRAKKGVLVGYSSSTRGYRIWIPEEETIYESKHVIFDESRLGREEGIPLFRYEGDLEDSTAKPEEVEKVPESTIEQPQALQKETKENERNPEPDGEVILNRITKTRQSGASKGQVDIYVKTPDETTLRSTRELKEYCDSKNLDYDDSLQIFSQNCQIQGEFKLKKKPEETNVEEAFCIEVYIPRNLKEAKRTKEYPKWKSAMDQEIQNMLDRKIQFCKHQAENVKNRHIDVKYKFVRELYDENWFDRKYVNTKENLADILTKALHKRSVSMTLSFLLKPNRRQPSFKL